jgi:hypothetical protein
VAIGLGELVMMPRDRLIEGRSVALAGEYCFSIALPAAIYSLTGSASLTALIVFFEWAPRCLLPFFGEIVVDRWAARRQLQILDALRVSLAIGAAFAANVPLFLVATSMIGLCNLWAMILFERTLHAEAMDSDEADRHKRLTRFSIARSADRVARIAGSAAAGLSLAWAPTAFGYFAAGLFLLGHALSAGTYSATSRATTWLKITPLDTLRSLFRTPDLLRVALTILFLNTIHGMIFAVMPVLLVEEFGASTDQVPLFFLILNIAAALLLAVLPVISRYVPRDRLHASALIGMLCGLLVSALVQGLWPFMVIVAITIALRGWYDVHLTLERNEVVPKGQLARILTVYLPLIYVPFALSALVVAALITILSAYQVFLIALAIALCGIPFGSTFLKRTYR